MALLDRWEIEVYRGVQTLSQFFHCREAYRGEYRQGHVRVMAIVEIPEGHRPEFVRDLLWFKFLVGDVEVR
jgi:hypothetical protein